MIQVEKRKKCTPKRKKCTPMRKCRMSMSPSGMKASPHLKTHSRYFAKAFSLNERELRTGKHAGQGQGDSSDSHRVLFEPYTCE